MGMTKCEGCGEERDVDGQMYDFGPTIACGQCWLSLLRFIRYGAQAVVVERAVEAEPSYWRRQHAVAIERAVEAEKARDALEGEIEAYKEALVAREKELQSAHARYQLTLADHNAALARIRAFEAAYDEEGK